MPDFATTVPEPVKAAIDVLLAAGFRAFTEAKIEDVRELDTGRRVRTFRNQGRYELLLAVRRVEDLAGAPDPAGRHESQGPPGPDPAPGDSPLKAPADMTVAELRAEAKRYPEIIGEHKMLKGDLRAAIGEARQRKQLLFKKFSLDGAP